MLLVDFSTPWKHSLIFPENRYFSDVLKGEHRKGTAKALRNHSFSTYAKFSKSFYRYRDSVKAISIMASSSVGVSQLKECLFIKNKFLWSIKWSLYRSLGVLIIVVSRHFSDQLLSECSNAWYEWLQSKTS